MGEFTVPEFDEISVDKKGKQEPDDAPVPINPQQFQAPPDIVYAEHFATLVLDKSDIIWPLQELKKLEYPLGQFEADMTLPEQIVPFGSDPPLLQKTA